MKPEKTTVTTRGEICRKTIVSFLLFAAALGAGWCVYSMIAHAKPDKGVQESLRAVLDANEKLFASTMSHTRLAKTFPVSEADKNVRFNGADGMSEPFNVAEWKMKVARAPNDTLEVTMEDIRRLPKTEIVFDFKCIEGWDQITHWGGVKMEDFIKAYHLERATAKKYMGLRTPDNGYYVGLDMPSAIHPQTLLAYEMNGKPLPTNQGAPLRLIIPVKYGIKHLKRIGTIYCSDSPPPDFWAERGYDYFAGH